VSQYFQLPPLRHQADIFEATKDLPGFLLFWKQGVGKTCPTIGTCAYLYESGKIQALVVFAPNGVHRNWANDELPKHMPERIWQKARLFIWEASKAQNKSAKAQRESFIKYDGGLKILCIPFQAILTPTCKSFTRRFMLKWKCLGVADESQRIKSPGAKSTKSITNAAEYCAYRRGLSGTPVTQGAFDVFSQVMFVDENFWRERGLYPYEVFKTHFGVYMSEEEFYEQRGYKANSDDDRLVDYKNLDELQGYLKLISHRLTLESAGIKLPPKVYKKLYFTLTPKQRYVYDTLAEEMVVELPETGDWLEAPETLQRLVRLQQITCGYVAIEAGEPVQRIDDKNPRLQLLIDTIRNDCEGKNIIWSKFTPDVDVIMLALQKIGRNPVRYDGLVSNDERERNKRAFQEGDATDFVGKPASGATGLTLHAAESVHYYSNSYNYEHRAQSEDRAHRIGLDHTVVYYDYIAQDTIDEQIVRNLKKKHKFAEYLLDDAPKEWL
jgi:SNF2 family DNA or RNA helicase